MKLIKFLTIPALLAAALGTTPAQAASEWKPGVPRTAYTTLFEWSWDSIAKECTNFLGPKGYAAVQVSPPHEAITGSQWWTRYQPVSYQLVSRSGNRAQFQNMVSTCAAAGVDVYVDTVTNHMASASGTGTAGSTFTARSFPAVPYGSSDFHTPQCTIQSSDYSSNRYNVTHCDLNNLPDLNTGSSYVQGKIAAYMNDLRSLGVAGFRMDAAKHIDPADLAAIKSLVPGSYFFTQEVLRDGTVGSATSGDMLAYQNIGTINEFNYVYAMKNSFLNTNGFNMSTLPTEFSTWGFLPSAKATVFVDNHDTERTACSSWAPGGVCDSLSTYNGDKLYLANVFMLAYDYGYPSVASGYYFADHDSGSPSSQPYNGTETVPANCSSTFDTSKWDCVHRDRRVANMVGFRNYVSGASVTNWVTGDSNQIAFARSGKGFVAINNSSSTWQNTFTTTLADGSYCNVLASDNPETGSCSGTTVTVSGGQVTLSIAPSTGVALHIGAKAVTDTTAPSVPTGLASSSVTASGATLSWTASTDNVGVTGYKVYRNGTQIGTSTSTSYTDTSAAASTAYSYTVAAYDAAGNTSAASSAVSVTTSAGNNAVVYYYRTDWTAVNIHYGINGTWTTSPGVAMTQACTGYWTRTVSLGTATSFTVDFNNGTTWDNNSSANYTLGTGTTLVKSGVVTSNAANPCAAADTTAPTVPTGLTSTAVGSNTVALSWTASTDNVGVTGYKVYRNGTQVGTTTTTSYTDSGLSASTAYSYTVAAYDAAGNTSAVSTALSVTTSASTACNVSVTFTIANANTVTGQNIYVAGNQTALGNWTPASAFALTIQGSGANVPWTGTVTLPASTAIQYKYIKYNPTTAAVTWESSQSTTSGNREFTTSSTCGATQSQSDGNF
ncbi:carbohydrate-binding module family 20 domain-containing protein [Andreprevotia chitinilytica]|uniref:carbohydrate-binding module family 20 domain-containing protein n=1 Tax=Andreprevotia chitinilytica TaxID=396808 RepID=UPI0006917C34|nr:carbohydrate-binding module family 20 domain-containing protein [Andreprevotia chitinilytica]